MNKNAQIIWDYREKHPGAGPRTIATALGLGFTTGTVANLLYNRPDSPYYKYKQKASRENRMLAAAPKVALARVTLAEEPDELPPPPPLYAVVHRVKCKWNAGDVWGQCMEWAMPGHAYCVRHHRRMRRGF